MTFNAGGIFDTVMRFAPRAAGMYSAYQGGRQAGQQAYEEDQEKKREQARQEREEQQRDAKHALDLEYLEEQIAGRRKENNAPPEAPDAFNPATDIPTQRESYFQRNGLGVYRDQPTAAAPVFSPSEERLREQGERSRTLEEAEGNAAIWARSGRMTPAIVSQMLRAQHGLSPGDANRLALDAFASDDAQLYDPALEPQPPEVEGPGFFEKFSSLFPHRGSAVATEPARATAGPDGYMATAPTAPSGPTAQQAEWDAIAAMLRAEGRDPNTELGPRP